MNTRIQVEHTITELSRASTSSARRSRSPRASGSSSAQDEIRLQGHAIECRINAEDVANGFLPSPGTITVYREPSGPGVRVDSGVTAGSEISPLYDPMIAKLIVRGADRADAIGAHAARARRVRDRRREDADRLPQGAALASVLPGRRDLPRHRRVRAARAAQRSSRSTRGATARVASRRTRRARASPRSTAAA